MKSTDSKSLNIGNKISRYLSSHSSKGKDKDVGSALNPAYRNISEKFLRKGPLFEYTYDNVCESTENLRGRIIAEYLGAGVKDTLSESIEKRIYHYYLPVYSWILNQKSSLNPNSTFVVGISAAQGCGKTTLTHQLRKLFSEQGLNCAMVSTDDFYLTGEQQDELAMKFPTNPLLRYRGNAGSHDVQLGERTIQQLMQLKSGQTAKIPRFDKSLRGGQGDRAPEDQWSVVKGPVDVVLFEGWSLGFQPLPDGDPLLEGEGQSLKEVNRFLESYSVWDDSCDAWVVIKVQDLNHIFEWRSEAEQQMRLSTGHGMTDKQVHDFVQRFMPAYRAYLPKLYNTTEKGAKPKIFITVDKNRNPIDCFSHYRCGKENY